MTLDTVVLPLLLLLTAVYPAFGCMGRSEPPPPPPPPPPPVTTPEPDKSLLIRSCLDSSSRSWYNQYEGVGYYKFYTSRSNETGCSWWQAQEVCKLDGAHLPVINSEEEFLIVQQLASEKEFAATHIPLGFHDLYLQDQYVTIDGTLVESSGYFKWAPPSNDSEYEDPSSQHCGAMPLDDQGLALQSCERMSDFFCEKELWQDYEFYADVRYFYKLKKEGLSWGEAWSSCRANGADLAVIKSEQEYDVLQGILTHNPRLDRTETNQRVHLGFHNMFDKVSFHTTRGALLEKTGYVRWENDAPSHSGRCGGLVRGGQLFAGDCETKLAYFCEHRSQ